jgi:hypothetical protein
MTTEKEQAHTIGCMTAVDFAAFVDRLATVYPAKRSLPFFRTRSAIENKGGPWAPSIR